MVSNSSQPAPPRRLIWEGSTPPSARGGGVGRDATCALSTSQPGWGWLPTNRGRDLQEQSRNRATTSSQIHRAPAAAEVAGACPA